MLKSRFLRSVLIAIGCTAFMLPSAQAKNVKMRLGTVYASTHTVTDAARSFADEIKDRTDGRIQISIFPDSQLGGDVAMSRELSRGSLDMAFLNPNSLAGIDQRFDFHQLPYIVHNFDEADKIFFNPDGIIQTNMSEVLTDHNMIPLAFFENEFRALTNSKRPVNTIDDIDGLKLRIVSSEAFKVFFEELNVYPVAMPFHELFTALQQGTVDGQDNGSGMTYNSRLFEAQKYMTKLNHAYAIGAVVVSKRAWSRLSEEDQAVFKEVAEKVSAQQVISSREMNQEYYNNIAAAGVEIVELTPENLEPFAEAGKRAWVKLEDVYGKERIETLRAELDAMRAK